MNTLARNPEDVLKVLHRFAPGYESARGGSMWNRRVPARYPDTIVQARTERDVIDAINIARARGLRVSVCSGGHSWSGNHLRDGGLLIDVSRLDACAIDPSAMRAVVGPGCAGHRLASQLARRGLFFPAGHCIGVCVGGYLLQGGFGWNGRALGPACESVEAIDVVLADGRVVHASAEQNAELYWSARGAGAGFFGVVTKFYLRLHRAPQVTGFALQTFPIAQLESVFRWAYEISREVPDAVELQLVVTRSAFGVGGPGIEVFAPVFSDMLRDAWGALSTVRGSPLRSRAAFRVPFLPVPVSVMYRMVMAHYPDGHRYAVDNMWTHAPVDDLLVGIERIVADMPPPPSHMLWLNWAPSAPRQDMAFSLEDQTYIALYGGWRHAVDDERYAGWAVGHMRAMSHLASGCQLADENLGERPARFVADPNMSRLDQARAHLDPAGVFAPWMGRK